jgi:citrate lyase gamma subunit
MAITFKGAVQVPIFLGRDALIQNAFVFENAIGSGVNVNIRRLMIEMDATVALTTVMPQVKVCRATNISGGILVDKSKFDTLESSDSNVRIRSRLAEGSAINATAGDTIYQQYTSRLHTAVEQVISESHSLQPGLVEDRGKEVILPPR